jgi:type III pantothenate kinase
VKEEVGRDDAKVVVTGGLGRIIASETEYVDIYDPNLTLKGIYSVYKKNRAVK